MLLKVNPIYHSNKTLIKCWICLLLVMLFIYTLFFLTWHKNKTTVVAVVECPLLNWVFSLVPSADGQVSPCWQFPVQQHSAARDPSCPAHKQTNTHTQRSILTKWILNFTSLINRKHFCLFFPTGNKLDFIITRIIIITTNARNNIQFWWRYCICFGYITCVLCFSLSRYQMQHEMLYYVC